MPAMSGSGEQGWWSNTMKLPFDELVMAKIVESRVKGGELTCVRLVHAR
jgi:hypothetical protein